MLRDVAAGGDGAGPASETEPAERPGRRVGERRWPWILLTVVLGVAVCAGVAVFTGWRHSPATRLPWLHGRWPAVPLWALPAAAAGGAAAAAMAALAMRRVSRARWALEDRLTVMVAGLASIAAATGMWRYFGVVLHWPVELRVLLFGLFDGTTLVCALRARRNMRRTGTTGFDGICMWLFTCVSAVLSSLDAGNDNSVPFRLLAPLVAALLWDRGLRLERRTRGGGREIHWRYTLERLLVWAGVAEPTGRTAGEVDTHRRISRLARAAARARDLASCGAGDGRQARARRRVRRNLVAALAFTDLASNPALQAGLRGQIGALLGVDALIHLDAAAPWSKPDHKPGAPASARAPNDGEPPVRRRVPAVRASRRRPPDGSAGADRDDRQHAATSPFESLAGQIADARAAGDYGRVNELLTGLDDHDGFARWLAENGKIKRLLALTAIYKIGDVKDRAGPQRWLLSLIPAPAGQVDKKTLREEAELVAPFWLAGSSVGEQPPRRDVTIEGAI
jgi:hypothetical protein